MYFKSFIFIFIILCFFNAYYAQKCEKCHKTYDGKINVHLIPHTHDDVGWLKTVDQYYYGSNKVYTPVGVQYIIDSVISELKNNPNRRFVYVESSFFWRWWEEQDAESRETVRTLVNDGRLEFLHGGWCMSDEATTHYSAMIDQMTLGLRFLNLTFGECGKPTVAWQIDPFGHSSEVAIEFAEMGFDGLFVSRIDYEDHASRTKSKKLEMIWRPDTKLGEDGELFTGVLYDMYTAPSGFCFDFTCTDEPIMDNKKLHGFNLERKLNDFINHIQTYKSAYQTNHLIMTMGGDFTYSVASSWFKNIDKLIKHMDKYSNGTINLIYSTPRCYLNAIHKGNYTWPVKENDDFFPYGSDAHSYWTGYFTSRPTFKYLAFKANNLLQVAKQLATTIGNSNRNDEDAIKRSVAILQHHDSVSGTEKQHVTDDYILYILEGFAAGSNIITTAYRNQFGPEYPDQVLCPYLNISQCNISESRSNFVITLYNPLSHKVNVTVRVPVVDAQYKVLQFDGTEIPIDLFNISGEVIKIPGRKNISSYDLVFKATNLPQMGALSYYVERTTQPLQPVEIIRPKEGDEIIISNKLVQVVFNKTTGLLQQVIKNGTSYDIGQNFYFYDAMKGYNYNAENRASGAYIFRPVDTEPKVIVNVVNVTVHKGKHVQEVRQVFSSWLSQVVRLYEDKEDIELNWLVGPVPVSEWLGKEVVTRYITSLSTNNTFYTDSNGRRWVKRVKDTRNYWNVSKSEPVASNYYPITTAACIRDSEKQLTIITDRPQGVTSLNNSHLEIMLHRRLLYDDGKGVGEPLDETEYKEGLVARGTHKIQLNLLGPATVQHRLASLDSAFSSVATFSNKTSLSFSDWKNKFKNNTFTLLNRELPVNVHILTLERWDNGTILLRLEHIFEDNEEVPHSKARTIDLEDLFFFRITELKELTLAANSGIKRKATKLKWRTEVEKIKSVPIAENSNSRVITLQPMQIRTFLLTLATVSSS